MYHFDLRDKHLRLLERVVNMTTKSQQAEAIRRIMLLAGFREEVTPASQPVKTFMLEKDMLFVNQKDADVVLNLLNIGGIYQRSIPFRNSGTLLIVYV